MKMSFRHCLLASAVVVSSLGFTASTQAALPFFSDKKDEVPSLAPMLEEATPAVVSIAVEGTQTSTQRVPEMFRYFFGAPQEQVQGRPVRGLGSGVIVDADKGYVVTNNHVVDNADKCGMFYIVERWLGGTLTNFSTIKKSIKRLKLLEKETSSIYNNLTKKEKSQLYREKIKLADLHRGIKDMRHLPAAIFVVDAKHEKIAISEAKCLGIPTFGIVDTNTDPNIVNFPIPANDDSIKTIQLVLSYISNSLYEMLGHNQKEDDGFSDESNVDNDQKVNE